MRGEDIAAIGIIALCVLVLFAVALGGYDVGYEHGVKSTQSEAAECGAGEYRADPETGDVDFVWKVKP